MVRAGLAAVITATLAAWTVAVGPQGGGPLLVPASGAVVTLAVVLLRGRLDGLRAGIAMLSVAAAGSVIVTDTSPATAASVGCGIVAVHELVRWSTEHRSDPPVTGGHERARWRHLCAVLVVGWASGPFIVLLAGGRAALAAWQAALAAAAAVGIAAVVAAIRRQRTETASGRR